MQKVTVKQVIRSTFDIAIEKFDEFVYVKINGDVHVFLRDFFDKKEASHKDYKWMIGHNLWKQEYHAISDDFLKNYYFKGYRYEYGKSIYVNALPILRRGLPNRIFQDQLGNDGYLYFRGKPVLRPIHLDNLWESYYDINQIVAVLKKHPKVSDLRVVETPYYNVEICGRHEVGCLYTPTSQEFAKWQKDGEFWTCHCSEKAIKSIGLAKYRKAERDEPVEC